MARDVLGHDRPAQRVPAPDMVPQYVVPEIADDAGASRHIPATALSGVHRAALVRAIVTLEHPNFAARLADYAGAPVERALSLLPRPASAGFSRAVEAAMLQCLKTAIRSLDQRARDGSGRKNPRRQAPATWLSSMVAGVTGGVSGFVGVAALPIELPLTTTLMLRAIADIARHNGEDLSQLEARLACLHVFALGSRPAGIRTDVGYFATRALLTKISGNATAYLVERGALDVSGQAAGGLISELVSRFSIVVSDRVAASAVPVIGAIGGATVNMIFMNHYQQIAKAHFTVRQLERHYGADLIRRNYAHMMPRVLTGRQ